MANLNVAGLLVERVKADPEGRCLIESRAGVDRVITFAELESLCDSYAHGLSRAGFASGQRVLLLERQGAKFVALTFALFKLGCVPVLLDPGMGVKPLLRCIQKLQPEAMVGVTRAHLLRALHRADFASVQRAVVTDGFWPGASSMERLADAQAGGFVPVPKDGTDLAAILYTSGSTGPAKGVEYRHEIFRAQVAALQDMFGFRAGELDMPGFPLFALFSTALGMACVLPELNPSRPAQADPGRLVRAILDWNVTNLQGSPAIWEQVGRYCTDYGIRLPSVRRVITFGAPISLKFVDMWRKLLDGRGEVYTPYGATEALPVSLISGEEIVNECADAARRGGGVCLGRAVPGLDVRIRDLVHTEQLLPRGDVGEIEVAGTQVTWAYHQDPDATAASKLEENGRIWHRMGDLGYFDEEGRLWTVGRKTHRVHGRDKTYDPVGAETIANQHPDVLSSALVGLGQPPEQKPALVVQLKKPRLLKDNAERMRIQREILQLYTEHLDYIDIQQVFFHKRLPVDPRHNAKIDREALSLWADKQARS